ncbi:5404_t:CDS:2 [Funneliformis caledonium]|uniref:5404_t:CDS:1 n=1 Tax=Funneliformis caledonium TaxID=1117310 RepID=A0A9N9BL68_9GLOM|nr:5404_t:CDS:2 [Funneliformis caledonium]
MDPTKNISNDISTASSNPFKVLCNMHLRTEVYYKLLIDCGLPFVETVDGDIKATQLLGLESDSVIFKACTACNERVAIKFRFTLNVLKHESQVLKIFKEVKDIPKLLYEDLCLLHPYIITSMVGRKINKVDVPIACNIIADILKLFYNPIREKVSLVVGLKAISYSFRIIEANNLELEMT